ncbi:MAG TPA: hypothetical protein VFY36_05875 [Solirubrobacteraceae bacterium]|nr:hypothetical protein [Solirubrobacteraceae bacterium]
MASVLAGCGGASVTPPTAPALPAIALSSSVLPKTHELPKRYACNPKIGVPPLKWGSLPAKTADLALVVFFVSSAGGTPQLAPQAALTGLKPKLHALKAGVLPKGSVVASDSRVMCPEKGVNATYFVRLYALKSRIKVPRGANVTAAVNAISGSAVAVGSLEVHYRRA